MNSPIPHDIPLPLPAAEWFLKTLLVLAFVAHILFVNLMVGGAIIGLVYEIRGRTNKLYDELAFFIASTVTVNKSMAVVLGVAPLLLINLLYTLWFYSANALTGSIWILVVPSVTAAFLLTYLHKYSWNRLKDQKALHISILVTAVVIFLFIPLVFLTNINLMLFPDKWSQVKGFVSALTLPNVFPRYLHFLNASLAATGLFLVWAVRSDGWIAPDSLIAKNRAKLIREFYSISFIVSAIQFLVGPLVLFTLPSQGLSLKMLLTIFTGISFAIPSMWLTWKELQEKEELIGQRVFKVAGLLGITVLFMASGRHFYRDQALAAHRKEVELKTAEYQELVKQAQKSSLTLTPAIGEGDILVRGKQLAQTCLACHSVATRLVGPPIREIAQIYAGNPDGIVKWAKAPGKKRPDYPQMPPMPLPDADLKVIAEYMLTIGK